MRKLLLLTSLFSSAVLAAIACSSEPPSSFCGGDQIEKNGTCVDDLPVATNTEGFLIQRSKKAVYEGSDGNFEIIDAHGGDVVLSGVATGPVTAKDTNQSVYIADFSDLRKAGDYYVLADGKRSGTFRVGDDGLDSILDSAMLGLYGQRCGESVSLEHEGNTYSHGPCHLAPARMDRIKEGASPVDDVGGWHDAGDYGKYVRNGAFAVAFLLKAYEHFPEILEKREFAIPEKGGAVPDILDEARVEVEWVLKAQFDDGSFAHKITALRFEGEVTPTGDAQTRYFFSTSTSSTAGAVALLAESARVYEKFDSSFADKCLSAARAGQKFLDEHPEGIVSEQLANGEGTGTYAWGDDPGDRERLWAYAELWETTGEQQYLIAFEEMAATLPVSHNFDWSDPRNLGIVTYLDSERDGRTVELVAQKQREIVESSDAIAAASASDAFGRGFSSYYWGSNGVILRMSFNLAAAHRIYENTSYLDAMTAQIDHVLGRNGFARSFVTSMGTNPVRWPHHRPSSTDGIAAPWPGLLIGGPHGSVPEGLAWEDDPDNYQNNEIAINWNTALVYAVVAAQATASDTSADCAPNCLPEKSDGAGGAGGAGGTE